MLVFEKMHLLDPCTYNTDVHVHDVHLYLSCTIYVCILIIIVSYIVMISIHLAMDFYHYYESIYALPCIYLS